MPLRLLKLFAYLVLLWESTWRSFWPLVVFVGICLAILLLDILPILGWALHSGVLFLSSFVAAYLLYRGLKSLRLPSWETSTRRIEHDSNLSHRPLSSLEDTPISDGSPLWQAHQAKLKSTIKSLTLRAPKPGVPAVDTCATRVVPLVLLAIAIPIAWGTSWVRIERGVIPELPRSAPVEPHLIDAWVSPPSYTGKPPFLVEIAALGAEVDIEVPEQSELLMQVQGGPDDEKRSPSLWQSIGEVRQKLALEKSIGAVSEAGAYRFEGPLLETAKLEIYQGADASEDKKLLQLTANVIADSAPLIKHQIDPRMTDAGSLRLEILGSDDYGLKGLNLKIDLAAMEAERSLSELELLYQNRAVDLPKLNSKSIDFTEFLDLSAHPLAGEEVTLALSVEDFAGHRSDAETKAVVFPKQVFENPIAKQVIKLRQQIFRRPEAKDGVGVTLAALSESGSLAEEKSAGVRRALNDLSEQTLKATELVELDQVVRRMWDLAKRLDDNPVRRAEEKLRKLEEQLRDALERGAPEAELLVLMDQLKEAMQEYQQAVINEKLMEMLESGELNTTQDAPSQNNQMDDLASELEALTRKGAREKALELLDELKEMMENLKNAELELNLQGQNPNGMQGKSPAMEMMEGLADIMREQQSMLNDSFRQKQQGTQPNQQRDRENAMRQEELRRQLGETMRGMGQMFGGEIPDGLGQAERAMKDAVDGLKKSNREQTLDNQAKALNELQRSAKSMADMMAQSAEQQGQGQPGQGQPGQGQPGQGQQGQGKEGDGESSQGKGGQGGDQAGGTDPLGRSYSPNADPLDLTPEQTRRASRDVRDELRRRAGEPDRSQQEQSYIEDLLEEF